VFWESKISWTKIPILLANTKSREKKRLPKKEMGEKKVLRITKE
jgi:hypothetical protein